jgi:hypothetical protein
MASPQTIERRAVRGLALNLWRVSALSLKSPTNRRTGWKCSLKRQRVVPAQELRIEAHELEAIFSASQLTAKRRLRASKAPVSNYQVTKLPNDQIR